MGDGPRSPWHLPLVMLRTAPALHGGGGAGGLGGCGGGGGGCGGRGGGGRGGGGLFRGGGGLLRGGGGGRFRGGGGRLRTGAAARDGVESSLLVARGLGRATAFGAGCGFG